MIALFSGIFCNEADLIHHMTQGNRFRLITDDQVLDTARDLSGIESTRIKRAFLSPLSVFNPFTHEKERTIAYLRLALARMLDNEPLVVSGYTALLIPKTLVHLLRVCLIAEISFRTALAQKEGQISQEEAFQLIRHEDDLRAMWTQNLFSVKDPWETDLYDLKLSMEKTDPANVLALIQEGQAKGGHSPEHATQEDFLLAATLEVALVNEGHIARVQAKRGRVILTIIQPVAISGSLEDELKTFAESIPGVESVEIRVVQAGHSQAYRKKNFELPSKVLLVDDEREFVQTLSERLQMREVGAVATFDGQSALDLVQRDAPEVMVIDLKMPGIDGMEILKQVKQTHPEIQVIVLTGHGSERDRKNCMDLGAYAYLQKPVDISLLSQTLKNAHEKLKTNEKACN